MELTIGVTGRPDAGGRRSPALILVLTAVAFFMVALDALVVVTALPAIHRSLGGSLGTLEWSVNSYGLTFAAGIMTAAALGDRLGRRRVYVAGLLLFTVASAACALAPTAAALIAARAVQGVGAAAVTPLSLTIATSAFPPARRGSVMGVIGALAGLAVAGGPLVGGVVVPGPRLALDLLDQRPGRAGRRGAVDGQAARAAAGRPRLDLPGVPLVAGATVALTWGLVQAGECRLGVRQDRDHADGWRRAAGRLRHQGAAGRRSHAAAAAVPLRPVRRRQRHRLPDERGDHGRGVPHRPVLPARHGLRPMAIGLAVAAVEPRRRWSSPRSPERWPTGSVPARCCPPACCCRRPAWPGSPDRRFRWRVQPVRPPADHRGHGYLDGHTDRDRPRLSARSSPPTSASASGVVSTLQRFGGAFGVAAVATAVFSRAWQPRRPRQRDRGLPSRAGGSRPCCP